MDEAVTHKTREMLMKQRTMTSNSLRGLMAEFGIVVPEGAHHIGKLLAILADPEDTSIADMARAALNTMREMMSALNEQIAVLDKTINAQVRDNPTARHVDTIPGFGPSALTACRRIGPLRGPIRGGAIAAIVSDPRHFDGGRDFAASLGLVPRQVGTGGKVKLGPISKRGNGYLRRLLMNEATAVLNGKNARNERADRLSLRRSASRPDPWRARMLESKPKNWRRWHWPTRWRASPGR
jgi:transposase